MPSQKKRGGAYSVRFSGLEAAGNLRPRENTLAAPTVTYDEAGAEDLYCLVIWDPDAPSAPSYLHFLVTNTSGGNLSNGTVVLPYTPPTPPPGSGVHRYYVGLYKQPGQISVGDIGRRGFSIKSLTDQYGLSEVGVKMVRVAA